MAPFEPSAPMQFLSKPPMKGPERGVTWGMKERKRPNGSTPAILNRRAEQKNNRNIRNPIITVLDNISIVCWKLWKWKV